ncbi:MAG: acyltransferase [Eubacterium sp.]|nr:acyltransferase [Eubacterium sp.]
MKTEKVKEYSYLRTIACIAIIFIHVLNQGISKYAASIPTTYMAYWSVLNNMKWGVPAFMMVTGMLLLDPERKVTYPKLFSSYVARALKALICFGVIFTVLDTIYAAGTGSNPGETFKNGIYAVFAGQSWAHLWYLYALIGLYLLLPFYRMIAAKARQQDMKYLLGVYIAFLSILPFVTGWDIKIGFYIHVSSIYPFWMFFGFYLKKWGFKKNFSHYLIWTVIATAAIIIVTVIRWKLLINPLDRLFNYSSVLVILQTYGITGMVHYLKMRDDGKADRFLLAADRHSFGIYLIHMIFIWLAYTVLKWDPFLHGGFLGVVLLVVISFVLAWIADIFLRKVPFFNKIL